MDRNVSLACEQFDIEGKMGEYLEDQFKKSLEIYMTKKDNDIMHWVQEGERDLETSIRGNLPQPRVIIPISVTVEKLIEIQQKLVKCNILLTQQNT